MESLPIDEISLSLRIFAALTPINISAPTIPSESVPVKLEGLQFSINQRRIGSSVFVSL